MKKKLITIIGLLVFVALCYAAFSYLKPESRFSYNSVFAYSKTHTYDPDETFKYGAYSFNVRAQLANLTVSCPEYDKSKKFSDLYNCTTRLGYTENNKSMELRINIENITNKIQLVSANWLKLTSDRGKIYSLNDLHYFQTGDLMPKASREGTFFNIIVEKGEKEFYLTIQLPNLAPQIVKINNN